MDAKIGAGSLRYASRDQERTNVARPKIKEREVEQGSDKRKESNEVERGIRSEDVA